ncbi:MAG: hypothetical protein NTW49_01600 [Bacteroidia bacterium]|nr:hypothetical protein [Bacteroidia bacterium]
MIHTKVLRFFLLFSFVISIISCDIINPTEEIPSYLKIDTIRLTTNPSQGKNTSSITDVWVYIDGSIVGVYEMPATFPVLATGRHHVTLYPGIKKNGIAATRIIYPFYTWFDKDTTLAEKGIMTINPTVRYNDSTKFSWIEDFEDAGLTIDTTYRSQVPIRIIHDGNNNQAGYAYLDSSQTLFECRSNGSYVFPLSSSPVFLEMDYKNTIVVTVGLFITKATTIFQQPVIYLNPTSTWKKICIDLTYYTQTTTDAINYSIFFGMLKTDTLTTASLTLDNIKLVHF